MTTTHAADKYTSVFLNEPPRSSHSTLLRIRRWLWAPYSILILGLSAAGACAPKPSAISPIVQTLSACESLAEAMGVAVSAGMTARDSVRLSGAVNQTVAFQLVLRTPSLAITGVELSVEVFVQSAGVSTSPARQAALEQPPGYPRAAMYRLYPITVERYPNWYLRCVGPRQPRKVFDALLPINAPRQGQPFTLLPGEPLAIWVELRIPKDAWPGDYTSAVIIRDHEKHQTRVPINLLIRDVFLRTDNALPVFADVQLDPLLAAQSKVDPNNLHAIVSDEGIRRSIVAAFRLLHDHGLSPFTDQAHPILSQKIDGRVLVDWNDYDVLCAPLIDGTAYEDARPAAGWPLPVDLQQPDPVQYDGLNSPAYATVLKDYLAAVRAHFAEKGWLQRCWVWFALAQGVNPSTEEIAQLRLVASLIHAETSPTTAPASPPAVGRLPFVSILIPQSMAPFGWLDHRYDDVSADVDIWATPARFHHRPTLAKQKAAGKKIWLPPDQPPFGASLAAEAPITQPRALVWQAFLDDSDAVILRETTNWPRQVFDQPIRERSQTSDTWLLYPGELFGLDEPVPSVRLKQLQQGLQDVQLLRILQEQGRAETARLLAGSVIKAFGTDAYGDHFLDGLYDRWIHDGPTWQLARDLLLEEAAAAVSERPDEILDRAANRAAWAKFLSATRRLTVTPESTRAVVSRRTSPDRLSGKPRPRRILTFTHDVALRTELRTTVQGRLRLGALPPGARAVRGLVEIGPINEMELVRRSLAWELDGPMPCDLDGHYLQRIVFDAAASGEVQADAVLSIVQAPPATKPIQIDGDLSDWLPNEFNSAGDFRLIQFAPCGTAALGCVASSERTTFPPSAAHRPKAVSQTVVYLCRDAANLYIGIHAATPPTDETSDQPQRVTNDVEYEGTQPVGEDLVEILLDPTNCATRPDDLYHIVVKADGIGVFEKGVGIKPPICRRGYWPEPLPKHAVQRTEQDWSAEIAIPLAVFGGSAARSGVWGLNIARMEPRRGEYSDWARAPRHCYDPRTLGNLIWAE